MFSRLEWTIAVSSTLVWVLMISGGHVFLPDDVYFYLHIAGRIVSGQGSTFNGITSTNGYHPLWMLACLLLRLIVSEPHSLIRALFILCAVLHLASLAMIVRILKRLGIQRRWPALLLFAYYNVANPAGSEFHISVLFLLLVIDTAVRAFLEPLTTRVMLSLGAFAGLAMLSRLDNVFFLGAVLAMTALGPGRSAFIRSCLTMGTPLLLIVGPYLIWNRIEFGAFVPISGTVKMTFGRPGVAKLGRQAIALALVAATGPLVFARTRLPRLLGSAIAGGALLHFAYVVVRMDGSWPWYFATELLAACFAVAYWSDRAEALLPKVPSMARAAIAVVLILGAVSMAIQRRMNHWRSMSETAWYLDAAKEIDRVVPPGEAMATLSSPGSLAYFSHRGIFAFDGLTLDFAYHDEAAEKGLQTYLRENRITYLFGVAPDSDEARQFAERTKAEGQMEGTVYQLGPDDRTVATLTVLSGLNKKPLGTFEPAKLPVVSRKFCSRDAVIWKLE